jgi:hypothetical protein
MTFECKINTTKNHHSSKLVFTLDLDVVNTNRDGFALGVISLARKNGLYNMKMGNVFRLLLVTPTILTIKIIDPLAPYFPGL